MFSSTGTPTIGNEIVSSRNSENLLMQAFHTGLKRALENQDEFESQSKEPTLQCRKDSL